MKHKFTLLAFLVAGLLSSQSLWAQTIGDYQTTGTGNWNTVNSWARWNGTTWVTPAPHVPTSADNVITILSGHTITLDVAITADQLVVAAGGILNLKGGFNLTLNHPAAGDDLTINGEVQLGKNDTLIGNAGAMVRVHNGILTWTSGTLSATTIVDATGTVNLSFDATKILNANLTNNGIFNWASGTLWGGIYMNGATFTNNGTIIENFSSARGFFDYSGTNAFINTGIFTKTTAFEFGNFNVPVTNSGTLNGKGRFSFTGTVSNTGILLPGNISGSAPDTMSTTIPAINGQTTTLQFFISSTGGRGGANFDSLTVAGAGPINVTSDKLKITDLGISTDPVGKVYTVLSAPGSTITGPFASTSLSPGLGNVIITATSVTVQKISPIPLTWGPFNAFGANNAVQLSWSTLQEQNTSYFVVEYSTDDEQYTAIGTVAAAGNSSGISHYSFTHTNPQLNGINYYRLREVDLNGKSAYSVVRAVRFANGTIVKVLVSPNPVRDLLQLNVQEEGISAVLADAQGRKLRTWVLQHGSQQVNIGDLPAGIYYLLIYQNHQRVDTQPILKF